MRHQVKLNRLLAYIYMPVIFTVMGYAIVYLAAKPIIDIGRDLGSLLMGAELKGEKADNSIYMKPDTANGQPESIPFSEIQLPQYGQHFGEMTCEAIGLDAPVFWGDSNEILRSGIGQSNASMLPGYGGTLLLCAHNTTFFAPLQEIKKGDIVTYSTSYGVYEYEITDTKVLDHKDESAFDLLQEEKEQLVLYTCYPFERMVGTKTDRLFVYGDKISGPDLIKDE